MADGVPRVQSGSVVSLGEIYIPNDINALIQCYNQKPHARAAVSDKLLVLAESSSTPNFKRQQAKKALIQLNLHVKAAQACVAIARDPQCPESDRLNAARDCRDKVSGHLESTKQAFRSVAGCPSVNSSVRQLAEQEGRALDGSQLVAAQLQQGAVVESAPQYLVRVSPRKKLADRQIVQVDTTDAQSPFASMKAAPDLPVVPSKRLGERKVVQVDTRDSVTQSAESPSARVVERAENPGSYRLLWNAQNAVKSALTNPQNVPQAADACLKILKNAHVSPDNRLKAAKLCAQLIGYEREAAYSLLSICQDKSEKVLLGYKEQARDAIKTLQGQKDIWVVACVALLLKYRDNFSIGHCLSAVEDKSVSEVLRTQLLGHLKPFFFHMEGPLKQRFCRFCQIENKTAEKEKIVADFMAYIRAFHIGWEGELKLIHELASHTQQGDICESLASALLHDFFENQEQLNQLRGDVMAKVKLDDLLWGIVNNLDVPISLRARAAQVLVQDTSHAGDVWAWWGNLLNPNKDNVCGDAYLVKYKALMTLSERVLGAQPQSYSAYIQMMSSLTTIIVEKAGTRINRTLISQSSKTLHTLCDNMDVYKDLSPKCKSELAKTFETSCEHVFCRYTSDFNSLEIKILKGFISCGGDSKYAISLLKKYLDNSSLRAPLFQDSVLIEIIRTLKDDDNTLIQLLWEDINSGRLGLKDQLIRIELVACYSDQYQGIMRWVQDQLQGSSTDIYDLIDWVPETFSSANHVSGDARVGLIIITLTAMHNRNIGLHGLSIGKLNQKLISIVGAENTELSSQSYISIFDFLAQQKNMDDGLNTCLANVCLKIASDSGILDIKRCEALKVLAGLKGFDEQKNQGVVIEVDGNLPMIQESSVSMNNRLDGIMRLMDLNRHQDKIYGLLMDLVPNSTTWLELLSGYNQASDEKKPVFLRKGMIQSAVAREASWGVDLRIKMVNSLYDLALQYKDSEHGEVMRRMSLNAYTAEILSKIEDQKIRATLTLKCLRDEDDRFCAIGVRLICAYNKIASQEVGNAALAFISNPKLTDDVLRIQLITKLIAQWIHHDDTRPQAIALGHRLIALMMSNTVKLTEPHGKLALIQLKAYLAHAKDKTLEVAKLCLSIGQREDADASYRTGALVFLAELDGCDEQKNQGVIIKIDGKFPMAESESISAELRMRNLIRLVNLNADGDGSGLVHRSILSITGQKGEWNQGERDRIESLKQQTEKYQKLAAIYLCSVLSKKINASFRAEMAIELHKLLSQNKSFKLSDGEMDALYEGCKDILQHLTTLTPAETSDLALELLHMPDTRFRLLAAIMLTDMGDNCPRSNNLEMACANILSEPDLNNHELFFKLFLVLSAWGVGSSDLSERLIKYLKNKDITVAPESRLDLIKALAQDDAYISYAADLYLSMGQDNTIGDSDRMPALAALGQLPGCEEQKDRGVVIAFWQKFPMIVGGRTLEIRFEHAIRLLLLGVHKENIVGLLSFLVSQSLSNSLNLGISTFKHKLAGISDNLSALDRLRTLYDAVKAFETKNKGLHLVIAKRLYVMGLRETDSDLGRALVDESLNVYTEVSQMSDLSEEDKVKLAVQVVRLEDNRFREIGMRLLLGSVEGMSEEEQGLFLNDIVAGYTLQDSKEATCLMLRRKMYWDSDDVTQEGMGRQRKINEDAAKAIINIVGVQDSRGYEAQNILTITEDLSPGNAYHEHVNIVTKAHNSLDWTMVTFPEVMWGDKVVKMNPQCAFEYAYPGLSEAGKKATFEDWKILIKDALKEASQETGAAELLRTIYSEAGSASYVKKETASDYFARLFEKENIKNPLAYRIRELVGAYKKLPLEGTADEPSKRSMAVVACVRNILFCQIGKDDGIRDAFNILNNAFHCGEDANKEERFREFLLLQLQGMRNEVFESSPRFMRDCALEFLGKNQFGGQVSHYRTYMKNIAGNTAGLRPKKANPIFDRHLTILGSQIIAAEKHKIMTIALKFYTPDTVLERLWTAINTETFRRTEKQNPEQPLNLPFYNLLIHVLGAKRTEYLYIDDNYAPTRVAQNEIISKAGVQYLLEHFGDEPFVVEASEYDLV